MTAGWLERSARAQARGTGWWPWPGLTAVPPTAVAEALAHLVAGDPALRQPSDLARALGIPVRIKPLGHGLRTHEALLLPTSGTRFLMYVDPRPSSRDEAHHVEHRVAHELAHTLFYDCGSDGVLPAGARPTRTHAADADEENFCDAFARAAMEGFLASSHRPAYSEVA